MTIILRQPSLNLLGMFSVTLCNKRYNLLCTRYNMVLSSLIYIAMVIIVIIVIIILLRFLFGVLFIMPSTITDPANMLLLPRDAFLSSQLLGFT